jgi:hypothetical protein
VAGRTGPRCPLLCAPPPSVSTERRERSLPRHCAVLVLLPRGEASRTVRHVPTLDSAARVALHLQQKGAPAHGSVVRCAFRTLHLLLLSGRQCKECPLCRTQRGSRADEQRIVIWRPVPSRRDCNALARSLADGTIDESSVYVNISPDRQLTFRNNISPPSSKSKENMDKKLT